MAREIVKCIAESHGNAFSAYQGDCVEVMKQLPDECIDFSVYSPPFGQLFVYSDSIADMGNCVDDEEFEQHYRFAVREKLRITKPGRLTAVHCSDLPLTKWRDGHIGINDFSGSIIRIHEDAGWVYHGRRTIWRCPVVEMTRTKHVGLLYKQLRKDSSKSRGGMPDYLLTFIKHGENKDPITHTPEEFPLDQWQEWASPVWMTVEQSKTLNVKAAKAQEDERHLCPIQLDVVMRAVILWSNSSDVVLSPFMGIGSEGVESLKHGRRFVGIELKDSYFQQAVANLEALDRQGDLFGRSPAPLVQEVVGAD
jgi:DNA modification methylase